MKKANKTIIITGASGFVGSALVQQAINDNFRPIIFTRSTSNAFRINDVEKYCHVFSYNDIHKKECVKKIAAMKPQALIHCAWEGVAGKDRNDAIQLNNIALTLDFVKFAHQVKCKQWIGIGSQAEYGNPNCRVNETHTTSPTTIYGKTKLGCCFSALALCQAFGIHGAWVRLFSLYGPQDNAHWLIPYLIKELSLGHSPQLTRCEQQWDYLYIDDVAHGILSILNTQASGIFNLGSGRTVQLKKVVDAIRKLVNPTIKINYGAQNYRPDQVMHLEANISKIKKETGWSPQVSLNQGIKKTVAWFKDNDKL